MNCYLSTTLFLKLRMEDGAGSNDYSELCMIAVLFSFFSLSTALAPPPPSEVNIRCVAWNFLVVQASLPRTHSNLPAFRLPDDGITFVTYYARPMPLNFASHQSPVPNPPKSKAIWDAPASFRPISALPPSHQILQSRKARNVEPPNQSPKEEVNPPRLQFLIPSHSNRREQGTNSPTPACLRQKIKSG